MKDQKIHIPLHLVPQENQKVFLAISGGLDSVVLFHLLQEANVGVHLLHVNYNLRGDDSTKDEKFIRELAKKNAVPLSVLNYQMKDHLAELGGNLQNEARKIRYSFFQTYFVKEPNSILMTAHHFDDQMETFFMHLSRKSGLTGLTCMAEQNGNHQRPLLNYSKQELKDFALEKDIKWREDASNQENKYLRNKWRNEWLPLLKNQLPNLEENVRVLISAFQQERSRLEVEFFPKAKEITNSTIWSFTDFDTCSDEAKYIIVKELGLRYAEMERLIELRETEKSKFFELNRLNLKIWNEGDKFTFEKMEIYLLPSLKIEPISQLPKIFDKNTYFADSNKVVGQLKIRFWKEGDRIASIGVTGTQLISDIIKDAKIPSSEKKKILVVEDEEKIFWCVGLKVGRDGLADEDSEEILMVNLNF